MTIGTSGSCGRHTTAHAFVRSFVRMHVRPGASILTSDLGGDKNIHETVKGARGTRRNFHSLACLLRSQSQGSSLCRTCLMTRSYSEQVVGEFVQSDHRSSLLVVGYPDCVGGVPEQRSDLACGRQLPICVQELRRRRGRR